MSYSYGADNKTDANIQWEWVQGHHCPCQAGQTSQQVMARRWLAYTAAAHSCLTAAAAAAVHVMLQSSCELNRTTYNT